MDNIDPPTFRGIHVLKMFIGTPEQFFDCFGFTPDGIVQIREMLRLESDHYVRIHTFYTNYARQMWFSKLEVEDEVAECLTNQYPRHL